jgi:hypothetical protein
MNGWKGFFPILTEGSAHGKKAGINGYLNGIAIKTRRRIA